MMNKQNQGALDRSPRRHSVGFCLLLVGLLCLPGCGGRSYENENDKLRAQRAELQAQISELQSRVALREGELRAIREQVDEGGQPIDGVEPPRLAGLVLGMYSGPIDSDGDGRYDALRVYARPVDQHGRQVTAEGSCRVRLLSIPAEGEPITLLDVRFTAEEFHDAYRSGITGTHYTLKSNLPAGLPTQAKLYVTLTDAATGRSYAAEKDIELVRGASAGG